MNDSSSTLMVAIEDSVVFVKISGRATCHCSTNFKSLFSELMGKGFNEFVLDLKDCLIMDSTFLGVLAKNGLLIMKQPADNNCTHHVHLLNPNKRVNLLIDSLGVLEFFDVIREDQTASHHYEARKSDSSPVSKKEFTETCLKAHEDLIELNPKNADKFKDVTAFLKSDLERLN